MGPWQGPFFYGWKGWRSFRRQIHPFRQPRTESRSKKGGAMIIFVCANLKEIFIKKRDYAWPKPDVCPRCKMSKLWGHGFVGAYFDDFAGQIQLRRYRCPECCCVIRLRPGGYFPRIQATIETIRSSLSKRIGQGRYLAGLSRSRQRHWFKALIKNTVAYLGQSFKDRLLVAFDRLLAMGKVPVSGSM